MRNLLMSNLVGLLTLGSCIVHSASAAPPSPQMPPSTGVAAIWSQVIGNQVDVNTVTNYQPPKVEMRFVLPGSSRDCAEYSIWYRTTLQASWKKSSAGASKRSHDIGGFTVSTTDFPMTLCRVVTDATWYQAGVSSSDQNFMPLTVWQPPSTAIGAPLTGNVETIVAAAGSVGNQNKSASQIVMVTIGDTGCRGLPSGEHGRKLQSCHDQTVNGKYHRDEWDFPELMTQVETVTLDNGDSAKPDIFLHVGDYRYFWEDYKDTYGNRLHAVDNLGYWLQEFLSPAQKPLTLAPWVLLRGNHELCPGGKWYGHGWYYLFGDVNWPQQACNDPVPTTYFDIGPNGGADKSTRHRMVVFDNADPWSSQLAINLKSAVAATMSWDGDAIVDSTHWASHVPSVAFMSYCSGQCGGENDHTLKTIRESLPVTNLCKSRGPDLPRCVPSTLFAGHQHFFERIEMTQDANSTDWAWPQMYTVGHGGTKKDSTGFPHRDYRCGTDLKLPISGSGSLKPLNVHGKVWADERHGFVVWRRDKSTISAKAGWLSKHYWSDSARTHSSTDCPF